MAIQIDMTPDGRFREPKPAPVANKLLRWAIVIAVLAMAGAVAAFAFWLAVILVPVAICAALAAYGLFRFRLWQMRKSFSGHGKPRPKVALRPIGQIRRPAVRSCVPAPGRHARW